MRTRNLTERPEGYYTDLRDKQHDAALRAMGLDAAAGRSVAETIEQQAERHRAARTDRAARRYVPPENEYQMAGLRLQAQAQGEEFAATEHAPGTTLVSRPPVLHRGFAVAIVEASTVLTSDQKRLYRRYVELDRPKGYKTGGCFAKVPTIARRLGVAPGSVKRNRTALCRYGLLVRTPEGVTPVRWFPTLPPRVTCIRPSTITKGRATDAWIMDQSVQLDAVLSAQVREAKMAKQVKGAGVPRKVRTDASAVLDTICTPERHDLYPEGAQIVPGQGTNCTPRLPRFMPIGPGKSIAA